MVLLAGYLLLLGTRSHPHVVHLRLQLSVLVLQGNGSLVNFFELQLDLLLLRLLLKKFSVSPNHVIIGELAKHLQFIQQLPLAVQQVSLLLQSLSEAMDFVLSVSVLHLDGRLDSSLHLFFALNDHLLRIDYISETLGLCVVILLSNLEDVEGLH